MPDLRASLWRRAAGLVEPFSERALQSQVARGEVPADRAGERRGEATHPNPGGAVVWLHARDLSRALELAGVMARLWEEQSDVEMLVTTRLNVDTGALVRRLPTGVMHQFLPFDRPQAVDRFLTHWKPRLCLWSDSPEPSVMLAGLANRAVPVTLLPGDTLEGWLKTRNRARLRQFARVFATGTTALADLREAGVSSTRALVSGTPREDAHAPEIDGAERERLAQVLEGRPVWLAAGVPVEELPLILHAYRRAVRQIHQLVLIVLPEDGADPGEFTSVLTDKALNWAASGDLRPGGAPADVILADRNRGEGLWHHLATVSFIGGSLVHHGGQSPQAAAALGSAVLHGPHTGYFADLFARLSRVGAAVQVRDATDLGRAVARVIEPGITAEMAHAAWKVCSEGAEATDTIVAALSDLLDEAAE